jgi:hypothetical protein
VIGALVVPRVSVARVAEQGSGMAGSSPGSAAGLCCQAVISTANAVIAWSRCVRLIGVVAMRSTRTGASRVACGRGGGMAVSAPCHPGR